MKRLAEILSKPEFLQYCKNILGQKKEWKAGDLLSEVTFYLLKKEEYYDLTEKEIKALFLKVAKTEAHKPKSCFNKKFSYSSFDSGFITKLIEDKNSNCLYFLNGTKRNQANETTSELENELLNIHRDIIEEALKENKEDSEELYFYKQIARLFYEGKSALKISHETNINIDGVRKSIKEFINYAKNINNIDSTC